MLLELSIDSVVREKVALKVADGDGDGRNAKAKMTPPDTDREVVGGKGGQRCHVGEDVEGSGDAANLNDQERLTSEAWDVAWATGDGREADACGGDPRRQLVDMRGRRACVDNIILRLSPATAAVRVVYLAMLLPGVVGKSLVVLLRMDLDGLLGEVRIKGSWEQEEAWSAAPALTGECQPREE
ncbi:hypothetical protein BDZ91DRAFT_762248 [Kalaharituber pfeilii]|nr:hypothetical protein BDZ91DRAFT_762248 [Kalaharituber pfeilii]